jgi:hypothetical protein
VVLRKGAVLYRNEAIRPSRLHLPPDSRWIDALAYQTIHYARFDPAANLVYDGLLRGEIQDHGFVDGFGLGEGFGRDAGDSVTYEIGLTEPIARAKLMIRYRMPEGGTTRFAMSGAMEQEVVLSGDASFTVVSVDLGSLKPQKLQLQFTSRGGAPVELDGLAICPAERADQLRFEPITWNYAPQRIDGPRPNSLILKYDSVETHYGLAWPKHPFMVREILSDNLDIYLRYMVHNHRLTTLADPDRREGQFTNVFIRPILLPAKSNTVLYGLICNGSQDAVRQRLAAFDPESREWDEVAGAARGRAAGLKSIPAGESYRFSQERMAATVLSNVIYPIRTRGQRIRHYTPGRWWDSLYTWDSGFVGLGLLELDLERSIENLNCYLTEPGDPTAAFIHHGTPVPVQHYQFLKIWDRTQSRELLEYFYPRLRQYHQFLVGRLGSSTTRNLKSGLVRTWDYFYNSGGWDDYPPQYHVFSNQLFQTVVAIANTAHMIRTARILTAAAGALGDDAAEYQRDIDELTDALQRYAWDEESGYFGYVVHDKDGRPTGILRHESGTNFNMGLDGAYPLVAGACTPAQEARLAELLMTPGRIWSAAGLSAVDQAAPYFRIDGYWNGAVWMPHQWFFWQTMLDLGRADDAHRIAQTALDMWRGEVESSYNCYEHFPIRSRRGAGWHQFSGLSSPVLSWFNAYFRSGRLTVGLDFWINSLTINESKTALEADLRHFGPRHRSPAVLAVLAPGRAYRATWKGRPVNVNERYPGTLEIQLPSDPATGRLVVGERS